MIIAVSGKGGVGKTLVSALIVRCLAEEKKGSILAIDADPDANLADALGVHAEKTIGDIREGMSNAPLPPGVEKKAYLDSKVFEITAETGKFDFIEMGRPEGPGCYCAINHMLRDIVDNMSDAYDWVVIDCEAGLEHISRRTTKGADVMLIVTDASKKGFKTAGHIKAMSGNLGIKFNDIFLILNRVEDANEKALNGMVKETGIGEIGRIPNDKKVAQYDLAGRPLIDLPEDSKAYTGVKQILKLITR
ncbi:MAG: ATP-binding protein [Candidatus Altiarchaeales archaeon IMC4]|nr:MAG: ATP-binding protein [Candidatus Altiarchaeales archaeon IMC4]